MFLTGNSNDKIKQLRSHKRHRMEIDRAPNSQRPKHKGSLPAVEESVSIHCPSNPQNFVFTDKETKTMIGSMYEIIEGTWISVCLLSLSAVAGLEVSFMSERSSLLAVIEKQQQAIQKLQEKNNFLEIENERLRLRNQKRENEGT